MSRQYNPLESREQETASRLSGWYRENRRELPFRSGRDPYRIWVSEIMAQQTRMEALIPYYERFMARFPSLKDLAEAPEERVLESWAGLGYYSRARNLHRTARILYGERGGRFPESAEELKKLPGIGEYTAGAIASISFGRPEPAVDGNVLRVFSRLRNRSDSPSSPELRREAAAWVRGILEEGRPEILTQAIMELGALVCIPASPRCGKCPLQDLCLGYASGDPGRLPVPPVRKEKPLSQFAVICLQDPRGFVLVRKRTESLLKGMWQYLVLEGNPDAEEIRSILFGQGFVPGEIRKAGTGRHVFSHRVWQMQGYCCRLMSPLPETLPEGYCFVEPARLRELAFPAAFRFLGTP